MAEQVITPVTRRWTKPLMVAVPILALLVWVYSALQFSRPPLSFLPKNLKIGNAYYATGTGPLLSPIAEVSDWLWPKPQEIPLKEYLEEIEQLGFENVMKVNEESFYEFQHPNGDRLIMVLNLKREGNEIIVLQYRHKETRIPYCLVKRLKAMYDKKVPPPEVTP